MDAQGVRGSANWLEEALAPRVSDRETSLVFPSQAVADAWAHAAPRRFGLDAVESDRFLGWDRFKEKLLSARRKEKPADRLARTIWAAGIIARQGRKPFLRSLAGPGLPSPAFVPWFASLPPSLLRATATIEGDEGKAAAPGDGGLEDLRALKDDYAAFLLRHGLFEPGWEAMEVLPARGSWLIIAPELIEDFSAYEGKLISLSPRVEILRLPDPGKDRPQLLSFQNSFEEMRWTFLEAGRLLDEGWLPEDIVITVPGLETSAPYVERAAKMAGVPASLKGGGNLAASPFGRLLGEISEAASCGFDFDAFRALLLDRFVAWKNAGATGELLGFGVDFHAYASYSSRGKRVDVWEESFALAGGRGELRNFYRRLTQSLRAIEASPDFTALRKAIFAFRSSFLDEGNWTDSELRQVERAMVELEGLARTEAELGAAGSLDSPFALYRSILAQTTYVAQASPDGAIPVYPWRVSALHPAARHFVLGASQDGIRVSYASLPFLREDQKAALGQKDKDASIDFAQAYSLSGERPSGTVFSFAIESFSGWSVPHPFFTTPSGPGAEREAPKSPMPPANFESLRQSCPLRAESAAWRGEAAMPHRILSFQSRSFEAALPSLGEKPSSFERDLATKASVGSLGPRITTKEGHLRLSATALGEYLACPFAWLLARGLRIEAKKTGIGFFDALLAGEMAHAALKALLEAMAGSGPFRATNRAAYEKAAQEAVAAVLTKFKEKEGPFLVPMFEAYAPLLKDRLRRLIADLVIDEGWLAGELEVTMERTWPGDDLVLEGRIDRLARRADGNGVAIIDYKKRRLPKVRDLVADEEGRLGDFQIAAYVALCEGAGLEVDEVFYWSIEDARRLPVLGPGAGRGRPEYDREILALEDALREVARRIRAGDFGMTGRGEMACKGCPWKSTCRERYATE